MFFDLVEGFIGSLVQAREVLRVLRIQGGADADGHGQWRCAVENRFGQGVEQALGDFTRLDLGVGTANQHRELVAAQPRHQIIAAHMLVQALSDGLQHLIASAVTVLIVDRLEVIEVEQHQGHGFTAAQGIGHGRFGALHQVATVGQFGQRVMEGGVLELQLTFAQLLVGRRQFGGALIDGIL